VNLLKNDIPLEQAKVLADILNEHPTLKSLCGNNGDETELDMSGKEIGAEGAIMLAPEIAGNGTLTTLILKDNKLLTPEAGKVLSNMLAANTVLKELDVSSNNWVERGHKNKGDGPGFAKELAVGISGNGALSIANVMGNSIGKEMLSMLQEIMHSKPNLVSLCGIADDATEADLSGLGMDADDAIILASELPDKGALSSINLLKNRIPVEQAQELVKIMQAKEKLITLCGLSKEETELDFSNQELNAGDAVLIANGISDMGVLTSLHVGKNNIPEKEMKEIITIAMRMDSMKILCGVPFKDKTLTELDISGKHLGTEGAFVITEYLDGNAAISQFTFSGNGHGNTPVTMEISMTEADFSAKGLGKSGAIMVAAFLPKCT
jgi:hypothetical protein